RFQTMRPTKVRGPWKQAGMIESATLSAPERTRREIERLGRGAHHHPNDPEVQFRLGALLLTAGKGRGAPPGVPQLLTRNAENRTWLEAGRFLLGFDQYRLAREFLERAAAANLAANLDLAIAVLFAEGPVKALDALERLPEKDRSGDYFLLKAQILD